MKLVVHDNYEALSKAGAAVIAEVIREKPDAAIVVATGDTPMGLYRELARVREQDGLDTSRVRAFQLDEYLGVPPDDRRSLYGWMLRSFIAPLEIPEENVVRLPWDEHEALVGCAAYDEAVERAGGFDLAILGLGPNGHLGFNEPPSRPDDPTRPVDLTLESIKSNARYWGGPDMVPKRAVTAGMVQLLGSRKILLVVSGAHKHDILRQTVAGPVTSQVPSSYLQHPSDVTILTDRAAWPDGEQRATA